MEITLILAICGIIALGIGVFFGVRKQNTKNKEMLENVAIEMGATLELGNWKTKSIIFGGLESTEYQITFHVVSTGKSNITYLDLKVPCKSIENKIVVKKIRHRHEIFQQNRHRKPYRKRRSGFRFRGYGQMQIGGGCPHGRLRFPFQKRCDFTRPARLCRRN